MQQWSWVVGEEHVVMQQVGAARRRCKGPDAGRQAARGDGAGGDGGLDRLAQKTRRQRRRITVEHHIVGRPRAAVGQGHARHAAPVFQNARCSDTVAERGTARLCKPFKHLRQPVQAAPDDMRPHRLGLPDQRQDGGGGAGGATDISGKAPEHLPQTRLTEGQREIAVQRHPRDQHRPQRGGTHGRPRHSGQRHARGLHHRRVEGGKGAGGAGVEAAEVGLGTRSTPVADGGSGCLGIGMQVQRRPVRPPVPRQHRLRDQRQVILDPRAGTGEDRIEHPPQRENRWSRIDRTRS